MEEAQRISDAGWLQGSVLPVKMCAALKLENIDADAIAFLVTQDCDVVSESFEREPFVEALIARRKDGKLDSRQKNGKNPRIYEFKIDEQVYEVYAKERFRIDRQELANFSPDVERALEKQTYRDIAYWTGRKFYRPSMPNELVKRLGKNKTKVEAAIEKSADLLDHVLIKFLPKGDAAPGETYAVDILILVEHDVSLEDFEKANGLAEEIRGILSKVESVTIGDCEAVRTSEVKISETKEYQEFDCEYMSLPYMAE